jgi:hypothetical protein
MKTFMRCVFAIAAILLSVTSADRCLTQDVSSTQDALGTQNVLGTSDPTRIQNPTNQSNSSITDYLPGWDSGRMEMIFKNQNADDRTAELARLIFRVTRQPMSRFESYAVSTNQPQIGDAVTVGGSVESIARIKVPQALVDSLEFDQLFRVTIVQDHEPTLPIKEDAQENEEATLQKTAPNPEAMTAELWLSKIPSKMRPGDHVQSAGLVVYSQSNQLTITVPTVAWRPVRIDDALQSLADTGFDLSQIDLLQSRQRRSLGVEDSDAFYGMLRSSAASSSRLIQSVAAIELLTEADSLIGHHLSFQIEAVRSTQVVITDPARREQLSSEHYWQIDGFADLGNHEVILKSTDPTDAPVTFGGRYPVSVVATSIPESLKPNSLARQHQRVNLEGYFFRLWSYDTDLMKDSKAKQFGPLIVATKWNLLPKPLADPKGANRIGVAAAVALIMGALAIFLWNQKNHREDLEIKRRRRADEAGDFRANKEN